MSFLTENAFNYAKSKSISNMPVEPKETDYTESLAQLLSDKILAQMYGELKQLYVSWPDFDTFSTNLKKKLGNRDLQIEQLITEQLQLQSKAASEPTVAQCQGPSKKEVETMI